MTPPAPPFSIELVRVRQRFARPVLADVGGEVRRRIAAAAPAIRPGARIAVAAGSRGIANLPLILRATVESVRELGGEPFVVPAMGSHGGGTAEGQRELLAGLGVTEESLGCPIRSCMEVVELPAPPGAEFRLFMDRLASESDGVIVVNRVKPHTDFHAAFESGLVKMAVIGLGKTEQAAEMHRHGVRGLVDLLPRAGAHLLATGRVVLGVAIVENAYDETMAVEALGPAEILAREPALLDLARTHMPRLPTDELDLLIVDRMGKEISGTGMDTNILGRIGIPGQPNAPRPRISMVVVTDLTDASHGNATGMGLADLTTRRMLEKIDFESTNTNVATTGFLERAKVPMVARNAREAVEWALRACGPGVVGRERVVRIRDTLHLEDLHVSPAVAAELAGRGEVEVVGEPVGCFDEGGELRGG
jgi:uncharacterized protein (DUF362 family)